MPLIEHPQVGSTPALVIYADLRLITERVPAVPDPSIRRAAWSARSRSRTLPMRW